ncbi:UPF0481 protein At3g47200 [Ziziphus jujuba]|uniref:UPF0481 protein At3g47200 n=1 Tax=Ziziphus jujuba TaxID=326968 RepID=A0ABM3IP82_ZIZJJ|nr:UPF0481 protein At3g47200 [Ziziphus jujuba]
MEEKKMIYLNDFLQRNNVNLWQCFETVREGLEGLRSCYAEDLRYKENELELVKIIVVDAVFVVEVLLKCSGIGLRGDNDRMFNEWILSAVRTELLLLENQLPFFILEDLWWLGTKGYLSLKRYCYDFFLQNNFLKENEKCWEQLRPKHLLDLLRMFYEPASSTAQGQDGQQHSSCAAQTVLCIPNAKAEDEPVLCIPNATRLHEAGVELKMTKTNELLDIVFTNGTLEIPVLEISDDTESILRNLIAFEQCHNCKKSYLSHYARVMDYIINTPKDVDLLVEKGIVVNLLGHSDDVCTIINRLGDGVSISFGTNFHYARLYKEVDSHCKTPWHQWKATLKHDYFNTPWAIISFIAAVVLIVLTIIQTACSIISTKNGK